MKKSALLAIGLLLTNVAWIAITVVTTEKAVMAERNAWRKASAPVFEARHVPQLAERAEPRDLANAFNASYAMTYQERSKMSPTWEGHQQRGKIIIATANENWVAK